MKVLKFYTGVVGFVNQSDIPMGFPPVKACQKALFDAGIPATAFITKDIQAESRRLTDKGVKFRGKPQAMGPVIAVAFEDTCGNLINLVQPAI